MSAQPKPPVRPIKPSLPLPSLPVKPTLTPTRQPTLPPDEAEPEDNGDEQPPAARGQLPPESEGETNPLNPAGDSLDKLIQMRLVDDSWTAMLGELPCLEATESCIGQLQSMAIERSKTLSEIDQRVEAINQKIEEARLNNQKTVQLGIFEPLVQSYLKTSVVTVNGQQQTRGFFENIFDVFLKPVSAVNDILGLIGIPLFRNSVGGDAAAQTRSIAIADLQVKVAEVERSRTEIADKIREQVILQVLDFDQVRREFQVSQEIAKRETLRMKLIEVDYRFGGSNSVAFLGNLSGLDKQKAQSFREWARVRSQLARIKLLVLGSGD